RKYAREQAEEERKYAREQANLDRAYAERLAQEDRRYQHIPYLKIETKSIGAYLGYMKTVVYLENSNQSFEFEFIVKNIGLGPMLNLIISVENYTILESEILEINMIKKEEIGIKIDHTGEYKLYISYRDILNNQYEKSVTLCISVDSRQEHAYITIIDSSDYKVKKVNYNQKSIG
ncbi:MAG TPA: hypothetical protein DCE48_07550, partial [Lachnospiraceae bacterium]|nr:hypothetical protein [Lachnospiraceae bacterium]